MTPCLKSEGLDGQVHLALLTVIYLSFLGCFHSCPKALFVSWLWHSQHLGISNTIHCLLSQIHSMASYCLHADIPLPRAWHQPQSLTGQCFYTITVLPLISVLFILAFFSDECSNFLVYSISLATSVERAIFSPSPCLLCWEILSLNQ